jgi:hypothetical protein
VNPHTPEIIEVCEALTPERQTEVRDFARFLLQQQTGEPGEQRFANSPPQRQQSRAELTASNRW